MSERPSFLPPAHFEPVAPEPTGFAAALGRAQRRRRRQLGEAGVALGLAVALLAGLNLPTRETGQDRVDVTTPDRPELEQDDDDAGEPGRRDDEAVVALPEATGAVGSGGTSREGTGDTGPTPRPAAAASRRPQPAATASVRASARRNPYAAGLPYKKPLVRSESTPIATCVSTDFCAYPRASKTGPNRYTLTLELCRAIDAGPTTLDFDNDREAEFVVQDDDESLWTWSRGQRFDLDPETVTFAAGDCLAWSTDYVLTVDDYGNLLEPGDYSVRMWSYGEGAEEYTATTTITVE